MRARDADEDDETTRGFDDDVRIETAAARDDDEDDEDEAREEDAEAHEDYSCKTPFERLARDVEAQFRRWMDGAATSTSARTREFANHGLHWRKEAYGCELFVDETWFDVDDGGRAETDVDAGGGCGGDDAGGVSVGGDEAAARGDGGIYAEETIHRRVGSRDVF